MDYKEYYDNVVHDIEQLKQEYPFLEYHIYPTVVPSEVTIDVIAASKELIEQTCADRNDFLGVYSRLLKVIVPFDYGKDGCTVYGGSWIEPDRIPDKDLHLYKPITENGYKLCVGVPESFSKFDNVILENVKTAECILIAYERFLRGWDKKVNLLAYSHGNKGENEYARDRRKYRTK